MSELRDSIVKYLNDDTYYTWLSKEIIKKRKSKNYYCKRHDGRIVPLKELGDLFGIYERSINDHPDHVIDVLVEYKIPFYGRRMYDSPMKKYSAAISEGVFIHE